MYKYYTNWSNSVSPIYRLKATNGTKTITASSCDSDKGCNVTLDSGMLYIAGPSNDIQALQDMIGAKKDGSDNVRICVTCMFIQSYKLDCGLTFWIDNLFIPTMEVKAQFVIL